jgi:hypothetical protein
VLLLILLAVLAGAEAFTDIARFGERKINLLRRFPPYVNGTPSHDHLGDIFATLDAPAFQLCFVAWVAALTNTPAEVIVVRHLNTCPAVRTQLGLRSTLSGVPRTEQPVLNAEGARLSVGHQFMAGRIPGSATQAVDVKHPAPAGQRRGLSHINDSGQA